MLLILYGAIAEMGLKSRQHLIQSGFQLVEKYNYAVAPKLTTKYGTRNYVSEKEFYENTDSLFRYEVGGIKVGFNQKQISDAVCDKTNSLLTLSTKDISFLSEIKRVYGDKVCLIYAYIDDATLKSIIFSLDGITEDEAQVRLDTGRDVKQSYLQFKNIFDHVVIYSGEGSVFDYRNLFRQFDCIIGSRTMADKAKVRYADVFISYTRRDSAIYSQMQTALNQRGITVFDDRQLSAGTEWASVIADAIQNAKIVIPVITDNSLASAWVLEETQFALESAEKNGTLIIPVFDSNVNLDKAPSIKHRLELLSCVFFEDGVVADASEKLAEKIQKLLSAEANLKAYSKQVENYLCLKMYDQAKNWQQAHLELCDEVYSLSNGSFLDFEACLLSRIKLISIFIDMKLYSEGLELSIEALNMLTDEDEYDALVEQFSLCCAYLGMNETEVRDLLINRLCEFVKFEHPEYIVGNWEKEELVSRLDNFIDRFNSAQNIIENKSDTAVAEVKDKADDESKIAQYGELAIALFEDIIQDNSKSLSRHDLILGYERILNYCKHVGLKGDVADKCISRIAELNSFEESASFGESSVASEALKIYLGQALPRSGEYDVFISYKSEDEVLAKKVYDYLTQSGKEVFFAKETLPQLGDSEYRTAIFDAIERSKHMVVVSSQPDYLKTKWVKKEWDTFDNEVTDGRKDGTLILVLADDIVANKGNLPIELRAKEIVKMSEFRNRLLSYLR